VAAWVELRRGERRGEGEDGGGTQWKKRLRQGSFQDRHKASVFRRLLFVTYQPGVNNLSSPVNELSPDSFLFRCLKGSSPLQHAQSVNNVVKETLTYFLFKE